MAKQSGIACAGNWVLDHVKIIDRWPSVGELSNILKEEWGAGGSPFNLLVDFAHMKVPFPTYGIGCVGDDSVGTAIKRKASNEKIDIRWLSTLKGASSSYTDVMTVKKTGERTFFHHRGANALFSAKHIDLKQLKKKSVKIFHLGYLLLLDYFDSKDKRYGTNAARLFHDICEMGMEVSVDVVSESSNRFKTIVVPSLPYIHHLIINELEAERITSVKIRSGGNRLSKESLSKAALSLKRFGVCRNVVIHCPEGALWVDRYNQECFVPSLRLPKNFIVGTVGAGDAFCAGILTGIHENWSVRKSLAFAHGVASSCLGAANTTDGVKSEKEIWKLVKRCNPDAY